MCCHKTSCPFAYTDESEYIQNMGCLPSPFEILNMRVNHNKTWACHSNPTKPCKGALLRLKELKFDNKVIYPLITENDIWSFNIPTTFTSDIQKRNLQHLTEKFAL